jgi:RimJ/RimL family protein N-acetyltransferase
LIESVASNDRSTISAMAAVGSDLPKLSDGVVCLRPFSADDAEVLAIIWSDPTIRARISVPEPSEDAALDWVTGRAALAAAGEAWEWAIVDAATDRLAGRRGLKNIRWEHRHAHAACWVAAEFRGRQFAARSLRLAAAHAFAMGIVRVQAACEKDNAASIRSVLAAGMHHEGTLRSYLISNAGVPVDAEMFGLTSDDLVEAPALRSAPENNE